MIEKEIKIPTEDGIMPAFTIHPENGEDFPAVILYMDASGIREELFDMCRRIAEKGYFVLLPDLYYRLGLNSFRPQKAGRASGRSHEEGRQRRQVQHR